MSILLLATASVAAAQSPPTADPAASLRAELAPIAAAIERLGGTTDPDRILDDLYFGWFDRPYGRATLTVLVKTAESLEDELRLRERGRGRRSDRQVAHLLDWMRDAVVRAPSMPATPGFLPHRICLKDPSPQPAPDGSGSNPTTGGDARSTGSTGGDARSTGWWAGEFDRTLFAVLDESTANGSRDGRGDFDLIAALGVRIVARRIDAVADGTGGGSLARRADALCMGLLDVAGFDSSDPGRVGADGGPTRGRVGSDERSTRGRVGADEDGSSAAHDARAPAAGVTGPHPSPLPAGAGAIRATVRPITLLDALIGQGRPFHHRGGANGQDAPTDGQHAPTDGQHAPTNGQHAPTNGQHAPTDGWHALAVPRLSMPAPGAEDRSIFALRDPRHGESPAASIARRALARAIAPTRRFTIRDFKAVRAQDGRSASEVVSASVWISASEGMSLGIITGWHSDQPVERASLPVPDSAELNLFQAPARLEALAHAALDLLRAGAAMPDLAADPPLAVAVGADAVDPRDPNRWAPWTTPLWHGLIDRQLPFDVIPHGRIEAVRGRYKHVIAPAAMDTGDLDSLLTRLDYRIALDRSLRSRTTVRTSEGWLAERVWLRSRRDGDACTIGVANLSGEKKNLRLRGDTPSGAMVDVVSGETIAAPRDALAMDPWQVRILRAEHQRP